MAPQARGSAVFPLWCPARVCVSMDSSLGMSRTLLRGVCVCACVFSPTAASMASLHAALCTLLLSVDLRICLSLSLSPRTGPPLPVSSPPFLFSSSPTSSSSSSLPLSLAPPHAGSPGFFRSSLRGVCLHFSCNSLLFTNAPLSLSRCLIFVLCVNQASRSHSLLAFPSCLSFIWSYSPFPASISSSLLFLFFLYPACSFALPRFFLFLISFHFHLCKYLYCVCFSPFFTYPFCLLSFSLFHSAHFHAYQRRKKKPGCCEKSGCVEHWATHEVDHHTLYRRPEHFCPSGIDKICYEPNVGNTN